MGWNRIEGNWKTAGKAIRAARTLRPCDEVTLGKQDVNYERGPTKPRRPPK
jgi:hypothetical protein